MVPHLRRAVLWGRRGVDPDASLEVADDARTIAPNVAATLTAVVTNHTTSARDFLLSVRDINPAWVTFRPPALTLGPGLGARRWRARRAPATAGPPPGRTWPAWRAADAAPSRAIGC